MSMKACEGCGTAIGPVEVVPVADLVTGERVELRLCDMCRGSRYRTWRRRYEPVGASS
jgi:hypothetical protein